MSDTITDEELTASALAADPDHEVGPGAVALHLRTGPDGGRDHPLPEWYMPVPTGTLRPLRGWRRMVGLVVVFSFLLLNAYGLCSTYGVVSFG